MGKRKKALRNLIIGILGVVLTVALLILALPTATLAQDLDVEVQTGPAFKDGDSAAAESCTTTALADKFPFDFLKDNIGSGSGCPQIELFSYVTQMCWIIDIWLRIEPAFLGSLFVYGIFHW